MSDLNFIESMNIGLSDHSDIHISNDCGDTFFSKARSSPTITRTDFVGISGDGSQMMSLTGRYQVSSEYHNRWSFVWLALMYIDRFTHAQETSGQHGPTTSHILLRKRIVTIEETLLQSPTTDSISTQARHLAVWILLPAIVHHC